MSKLKFYKQRQVMKVCLVCGTVFKPEWKSSFASLGFCHKHRHIHYQKFYANVFVPWYDALSPEERKAFKQKQYNIWKRWVENNKPQRRAQALASYHKNKDKHRDRKHRATKKPE